jgi:allophanate hydrolase
MPLNYQLVERGAKLVERTRTAPHYRLYLLADASPAKPGLVRGADNSGRTIEVELWEMPVREFGSFVAQIPAPLGIGTLALEDGRVAQGFICEGHALAHARDISDFGSWRRFLASPP